MNKFRHTHNSLPYFELFTVFPQLLTLHPIVLPAASSQQPAASSQTGPHWSQGEAPEAHSVHLHSIQTHSYPLNVPTILPKGPRKIYTTNGNFEMPSHLNELDLCRLFFY